MNMSFNINLYCNNQASTRALSDQHIYISHRRQPAFCSSAQHLKDHICQCVPAAWLLLAASVLAAVKEKVPVDMPVLAAPNRDVVDEEDEVEVEENENPEAPADLRELSTELSTFWPKLKVTPAGMALFSGVALSLFLVKENKAGAAGLTLLPEEDDGVFVVVFACFPGCCSSPAAAPLPYLLSMVAKCRS